MKRSLFALVMLGALATDVWAGFKSPNWVYVNPTARQAYGSLGGARNSADTVQEIFCYVYTYGSGAGMMCSATDANGVVATCQSSGTDFVRVAASANGDSYINFTYDASGNCTSLSVTAGSRYQPKQL